MKVICINALNCTYDSQCGANKPHDDGHCEPCPFNRTAICVAIKEDTPCCDSPAKDKCEQCQEVGLANPLNH